MQQRWLMPPHALSSGGSCYHRHNPKGTECSAILWAHAPLVMRGKAALHRPGCPAAVPVKELDWSSLFTHVHLRPRCRARLTGSSCFLCMDGASHIDSCAWVPCDVICLPPPL